MQEHLILGFDRQDAEAQRDMWLAQNSTVRLICVHPVKQEPKSLLNWIGGKRVPRVSIVIEFDTDDAVIADNVITLRALTPPKTSSGETRADVGNEQTAERHALPVVGR